MSKWTSGFVQGHVCLYFVLTTTTWQGDSCWRVNCSSTWLLLCQLPALSMHFKLWQTHFAAIMLCYRHLPTREYSSANMFISFQRGVAVRVRFVRKWRVSKLFQISEVKSWLCWRPPNSKTEQLEHAPDSSGIIAWLCDLGGLRS